MDRHPGFGLFDKAHREFFDALDDSGWQDVAGYKGVQEKILSGQLNTQASTGAVTRLTRWVVGAAVDHPVRHDWCEEVFLISGTLIIGTPEAPQDTLPTGTYAVRPPHVDHGPFFTKDGCMMIEFMYYPPKP